MIKIKGETRRVRMDRRLPVIKNADEKNQFSFGMAAPGEIRELEGFFEKFRDEEQEFPVVTSSEDMALRDAQKLISGLRNRSYKYMKSYGLASIEEALHVAWVNRDYIDSESLRDAKWLSLKLYLEGQEEEEDQIAQVVSKSRGGKHKQLLDMIQKGKQYHEAQLN